jgi:hypothetical protein
VGQHVVESSAGMATPLQVPMAAAGNAQLHCVEMGVQERQFETKVGAAAPGVHAGIEVRSQETEVEGTGGMGTATGHRV